MPTTPPRISVIIPNWNGACHLPDCLGSLAAQTCTDFEIVIVDNGSEDESLELLARDFPQVRVVCNKKNLGFSAAVNRGIEATEGEFVVLLNNDTRAEPDWLQRLLETMDDVPDASFAACKMLRYDPPHDIDAAGDRYSLWRGSGISMGAGEPRDRYDRPAWVFGACAGAAIYRRELFEDIGLFDEDFFLIFEDVDFSLRAQVAGHRCVYVPEAIVYHKRGASTDTRCPQVDARAIRNLIWVGGKNLPTLLFAGWLVLMPLRMAAKWVRQRWRQAMQPPGQKSSTVSGLAPHPQRRRIVAQSLREGFSRLPKKRRATGPVRRLGSIALLPVLMRPFRVR